MLSVHLTVHRLRETCPKMWWWVSINTLYLTKNHAFPALSWRLDVPSVSCRVLKNQQWNAVEFLLSLSYKWLPGRHGCVLIICDKMFSDSCHYKQRLELNMRYCALTIQVFVTSFVGLWPSLKVTLLTCVHCFCGTMHWSSLLEILILLLPSFRATSWILFRQKLVMIKWAV